MTFHPENHRASGQHCESGDDDSPCLQIQVDLSAMLDGELDAASVRRVMVHSDVCASCRQFLRGIRSQARMHRELSDAGALVDGVLTPGLAADSLEEAAPASLRRQLIENRSQLARILYELGRGYVLMGVSPGFSRLIAREPVPLPEVSLQGRHLLDEVQRQAGEILDAEWVRAKDLFSGDDLLDAPEALAKGKRLLREVLLLDANYHEARIYLGHAHHVCGERDIARRELRAVLENSDDPVMRAFALESLGNVFLEEGRLSESLPYFHEVVDSGAIAEESRFFTAYFNLALAYGLLGRFDSCRVWLSRLYEEFPHKRRLSRIELAARPALLDKIAGHSQIEGEFSKLFPDWFPIISEVA